jgi:hypothetical protein
MPHQDKIEKLRHTLKRLKAANTFQKLEIAESAVEQAFLIIEEQDRKYAEMLTMVERLQVHVIEGGR